MAIPSCAKRSLKASVEHFLLCNAQDRLATSLHDVQGLLQSIPDEADLDVSVHIGYKAKKRRVTRAPMQQVLRNLPEGEITAIGKHGKMTGKDIRLSFPVRVLCEGSLLEPNDARAKLKSAYDYFVENPKIEA